MKYIISIALMLSVVQSRANDYVMPEQYLTFYAMKNMIDSYYKLNSFYPTYWTDIDTPLACVPFDVSNKIYFPPPTKSRAWKPFGCQFKYVIISSKTSLFEIDLIDPEGKLAFSFLKNPKIGWKILNFRI